MTDKRAKDGLLRNTNVYRQGKSRRLSEKGGINRVGTKMEAMLLWKPAIYSVMEVITDMSVTFPGTHLSFIP
jgi:hypothetical protein